MLDHLVRNKHLHREFFACMRWKTVLTGFKPGRPAAANDARFEQQRALDNPGARELLRDRGKPVPGRDYDHCSGGRGPRLLKIARLPGSTRKTCCGEQETGHEGEHGPHHCNPAELKTSVALVPPNPNEFESTVEIGIFLARCGTRSMAVSTDGLSRLMVGGATESRIARVAKMASTAPAAPSRWPTDDFVDDI